MDDLLKFHNKDERLWFWRAKVIRVIDGDSIRFLLDRGFEHFVYSNFRLEGIDTPEIRGRQAAEEYEAGMAAKARVEELIPEGTEVLIQSHKPDKYGRWLCTIHLEDGKTLNGLLIEEGHAEPY